jgi:hypothetical protein
MIIRSSEIDWDFVYSFCSEQNALIPVLYTLYYLRRLFGMDVPPRFSERIDSDAAEWLDAYMDKEGNKYQWKCGFDERMFDMYRKTREIRDLFPSLTFSE